MNTYVYVEANHRNAEKRFKRLVSWYPKETVKANHGNKTIEVATKEGDSIKLKVITQDAEIRGQRFDKVIFDEFDQQLDPSKIGYILSTQN